MTISAQTVMSGNKMLKRVMPREEAVNIKPMLIRAIFREFPIRDVLS